MMRFIGSRFLVVILLSVAVGCVSIEEDKLITEKSLTEIFRDREAVPAIADPEPVIEEPKYEKTFQKQFSFRVLDEISVNGEYSDYALEVLKSISEQVKQVDPETKAKFGNITLDDLVKILDPRNPLDPQLEGFLKKLLETEKLDISQFELPEINGLEELKDEHGKGHSFAERNSSISEGIPGDGSCAQEVFVQYGSGARSCGQDLMLALQIIEDNYLRRVFEAEERFENRNQNILNFNLEKLSDAVEKVRNLLTAIKETGTKEEIEEIRYNLGFLAATYAYHLRINFPLWHEYGLALNEWYYYKELELFLDIRSSKEAEADKRYSDCINWVNGLIKEEVKQKCPGDEPILY